MLVVPPATAYLLTDRLGTMLGLAVGFGASSAVFGYGAAYLLDCSIAGAMASVAGLQLLAAFLLSPRHGLLARWLVMRRLSGQLAHNLLLLHLQKGGAGLPLATLEQRFGWNPRRLERVLSRLLRQGWIEQDGLGLRLTPRGAEALEASGGAQLAHRW